MEITVKNTLAHFKKICVHKFWVAYYCFKAGLYWQGIMHDMSKFSWIEFWESVKYYQGTSSPINACKADKGYSLAWQHHKGRNPHHYEYWTDKYDEGTVAIEMPYKYAVELICDWLGAGKAYMGKNFTYAGEYKYVLTRLQVAKMHKNTADFVLAVFDTLKDIETGIVEDQLKGYTPDKYFNKHHLQVLFNNYVKLNGLKYFYGEQYGK